MLVQINNTAWEGAIEEAYGKTTKRTEEYTTRVMLMNMSGFPFNNAASKTRKIISLVKYNKVDILALAEIIVNWKVIPFMH